MHGFKYGDSTLFNMDSFPNDSSDLIFHVMHISSVLPSARLVKLKNNLNSSAITMPKNYVNFRARCPFMWVKNAVVILLLHFLSSLTFKHRKSACITNPKHSIQTLSLPWHPVQNFCPYVFQNFNRAFVIVQEAAAVYKFRVRASIRIHQL